MRPFMPAMSTKSNLAAQVAASSGLRVSHARTLSAAAQLVDAAGVRSVGASFVSELAAAGRLNTRLADIAGVKGLGANLAAAGALHTRFVDMAGMKGLAAQVDASSGLSFSRSQILSATAQLVDAAGVRSVGASFVSELARMAD